MAKIQFADKLLEVMRRNPDLSPQEAVLEAAQYYKDAVQLEIEAREATRKLNRPYYVILELATRVNHTVYLEDFDAFCRAKKLNPARLRDVVEGRLYEHKGFYGGNSPNVVRSLNHPWKPPLPQEAIDKMRRLNQERVEIGERNERNKENTYTPPPPTTTVVFNPNNKENQ